MSSSTALMDIDSSMSNLIKPGKQDRDNDAKWFDLYPNKDLMDPLFEGYKLSLDSFAQYKIKLDEPHQLDTYNFIESSESKLKYLLYQHLKLFALQNLLFVNQFKDSDVYYLDENFRLIKIIYIDNGSVPRSAVETSLRLPVNSEAKDRAHVSMRFVRHNLALFYDGQSSLYLCEIADRSSEQAQEEWRIVFTWIAPKNESTAVLKDAVLFGNSLHVMLVYIDEVVDGKGPNKFETIISWLQFDYQSDLSQIALKRTRKINSYSFVPDYITFETNGNAVNIIGPKKIEFVYDSLLPINKNPEENMEVDKEKDQLEKEARIGELGEKVIENPEFAQQKAIFTCEQLEECDGVLNERRLGEAVELEENDLMLRRLDGNTHKCTHKSYINDNKYLMEVRLDANKSPALCLRHDVDGILWQPHEIVDSDNQTWLSHSHTFLAFGYVQASKQEAKFRLAPANCSYVCIVDTNKHVYVYKQEGEKVEGVLRNRKSGKTMSHVAKQYLISLDTDSEIYGAYAANNFLLILLRDVCYVYRINIDS